MPIRLNLLAEAQAAEDQRRRDPVKRAIWIAALLIALMLVWASSIQLKAILAKYELGRVAAQMNACTNKYQEVVEAQKRIADINHRLVSLHCLATNRFLNGNLLNTLQQSVVNDVQLAQLRVDQTYTLAEGTKPKTNANNVTPGRPATVTEQIVLTLAANDTSASPGDEVPRYKESLGDHPYFQATLGRTNQVTLTSLSAPTISLDSGRAMVSFTLETRLPPKTR